MAQHEHEETNLKFHIGFTAVIGALLLLNVLGWVREIRGWNTALFLTLIGGYRIFWEACRKAFNREISADLAIAIAAVAALCIKQYVAAAEVIFIMLIGEGLELFAVDRTRSAIRKLLALAPEQARVRRDGEEKVVPIEEVNVGDTVIIRPGERVPVDGLVASGRSSVDQATITGESIPVTKEIGNEVFAGTVNGPGVLEVRVEAVGEDTKLADIVHLVEEAEESRAPVQRRVDKYARFFVPAVIGIAILTYWFSQRFGAPAAASIIRAVSVLIVACPCALVLATPTAVVAALGRLARSGILVKGGAHLEAAGEVDWIVFDKTGTLTLGKPRIAEILAFDGATENDVLTLAAAAERHSEHVLAELIVQEAKRRGLHIAEVEGFVAALGLGVGAKLAGEQVLVGRRKLLEHQKALIADAHGEALDRLDQKGYTVILVAHGGKLIGAIAVEDVLREEATGTVAKLKEIGIRHVSVLTGDNARVAAKVARQAGIRSFDADLLPGEKVAVIKRLQSEGHKVAMLGDGINDAPSLATANVGIAMGAIGTDIAMEAADIIFMRDDLSALAETIDVSRRTVATIKANIIWFALAVNILGIAAAATGWATPVIAAVLHQVSSLLVVLNSLRLLVAGRFRETRLGRMVERLQRLLAEDIPLTSRRAWERRATLAQGCLAILVLLYLASGLYSVQPGEVGVVRRFGRRIGDPAPPGLHYRLPWPMGRVDRVPVARVHMLEVGFRTTAAEAGPRAEEPPAYEWGMRHTIGRYEKKMEEAVMITGDENLIEATLSVHYRVEDPVAYLLRVADVERCVRDCAESAIRWVIVQQPLDAVLAHDRRRIEELSAQRAQEMLHRYGCGVRIDRVLLGDVHPPLEVVSDFRAVSSAFEEKHRLVNEAEAYAAERIELGKGRATAAVEKALEYQVDKVNRAKGDAGHFECVAAAFAAAPEVTSLRLFLETVEASLAPLRKVILDQSGNGRHQLFLFDEKGIVTKLKDVLREEGPTTIPATGFREERIRPE